MDDKKKAVSGSQNTDYPVLGVVQQVGDKYAVGNRAIVGKIYSITCPKCQEVLLLKAASAVRYKKICKRCGTPISYMGKEPVNSDVTDETQPKKVNKTQKYHKPSNIGNQGFKATKTVEEENVNRTIKPNAKLTWGSFFKKNSYVFVRTGKHYIGRDDDEVRSDISIHDEYVSRRSVLIDVIAKAGNDCGYKLTVVNAKNPVLVNGQIIEIDESVYLNYGDTILVGDTTLTFKKN